MTVLDQEGVELANFADAQKEAVRLALDIVSRQGAKVDHGRTIVIADDTWQTMMEVPF